MNPLATAILRDENQNYVVFGLHLVAIKSNRGFGDIGYLLGHHKRDLSKFVNILYDPHRSASYIIRVVVDPQGSTGSLGKTDIAFLIKVKLPEGPNSAESQVENIYKNLKLILGGTFSDYIWKEILDPSQLDYFLSPIDWSEAFMAEVRRREEDVQLDTIVPQKRLGFMEDLEDNPASKPVKDVYYVHPYSPATGNFETMLKTLMQGSQRIVLSAILSPTSLTSDEVEYLQEQIAFCEGHNTSKNDAVRIHRARAQSLSLALLGQYLLLQDAPFYMTFSVASETPIDSMLLEYIGQAITQPIGQGINTQHPESSFSFNVGGYDIIIPLTTRDRQKAVGNMMTLSQDYWNKTRINPVLQRFRFLFDGNEAVSAFYLPINAEEDLPGVETFHLKERPIPRAMMALREQQQKTIRLGVNHYYGFEQDVIISEEARRQHAYIVGQTGTGKTTLLKTMILSDLKAGHGLAVIDPHGEFYQDLLEIIPKDREEDVVLFNPSDTDYPVGFNLLEFSDEEERVSVIKEMRAVLKRYISEYFNYSSGDYAGAVFFQHMQNNMMLAASDLENPGTIIQVNNIFMQRDFWKRWLPLKWENPALQNWVDNYLSNTDYFARARDGIVPGDYFSSKLADFTNDPRVSLIFGQPFSTIDLEDIIENKKILLINLSKGLLGEANSNMLGMILIAKLNAAFMARLKKQGESYKPEPFYFYVDEFQNIATENFSILLAEARKFGLGLILANQYLSQIASMKILDAIFGNVGTIVSFRLGLEDARLMESQFLPDYNFQDLCNLSNYNAVMRTNINGQRTVPCNLTTILPDLSQEYADRQYLVEKSREKYGTPRIMAEYILQSSLSSRVIQMSNFYWEKEGTPEEQLIRKNDLRTLLEFSDSDEDDYLEQAGRYVNEIKINVANYSIRSGKISKQKAAKVMTALKNASLEIIQNYDQFLNEIIEPIEPSIVHDLIGIFNGVTKRRVDLHLGELYFESLVNHQNEVEYISKLIEKDYWKSAEKNLKILIDSLSSAGEEKKITEYIWNLKN